MTVDTHCLPTGSLGSGQCGVPVVPGTAQILIPAGSKRGVVVLCHGFQTSVATNPPVLDNGSFRFLDLADNLQSDGWVVIYPIEVGDARPTISQLQAVYNDVSVDAGDGSRQQSDIERWWDHMVLWVQATYGNWPIAVVGASWGGMAALTVATKKTSTITAYCAHHPVSILSKLVPNLGGSTVDFTGLTTTGIDQGSTALNALGNGQQGSVPPGLLGWGTIDTVVDYPQSGDLLTPAIFTAATGVSQPVSPNCNGTGNSSGGTPEAHVMNAADVTIITNWFTATVDPLAPAVH